jgi:hypothetical protein
VKANVVASLRSKWRLALRPASLTATISATAALQVLGGERSESRELLAQAMARKATVEKAKTPPYSSRTSIIIMPFASPRIR